MRLLSWNLQGGRGSGSWLGVTRALASEAILLQETTDPTVGDGVLWRPVAGCTWGSAVVVTSGSLNEVRIEGYGGWVIGGEWLGGRVPTAAESRCFVFSAHSPTSDKTAKRMSYIAESRALVRAIVSAVPPECQLIIGGDFNFKSFGERMAYEPIHTTLGERAALAEYAAFGLVSAWQAGHPDAPLPQTLRWAPKPTTPYHCDGFLLRPSVAARSLCEVLSAPALAAVSDHNPMAAWLW